jgi:nitrate reductase gamma subunit
MKMNLTNTLAFLVFPYLALTTFVIGHAYRYIADPFSWNASSSEFLEKKNLYPGITIFHWGILLTLIGHAGGLLIPQTLYDIVSIDGQAHSRIAHWSGLVFGVAAFVGSVLLLWRRVIVKRIQATTTLNDYVTLVALIFVTGTGLFNVVFGHFYVLDTIAPWIRGIAFFQPNAELMRNVPLSYKVHILSAFALLGFSPFSRLVHIWSAPFSYAFRRYVVLRKYQGRVNDGIRKSACVDSK